MIPIPFYLVAVGDPKAQRRVLEFFNQRFDLGIDFSDLDEEIKIQSEKLAQVRNGFPDIDESIKRLESNLMLSEEELPSLSKQPAAIDTWNKKNTGGWLRMLLRPLWSVLLAAARRWSSKPLSLA